MDPLDTEEDVRSVMKLAHLSYYKELESRSWFFIDPCTKFCLHELHDRMRILEDEFKKRYAWATCTHIIGGPVGSSCYLTAEKSSWTKFGMIVVLSYKESHLINLISIIVALIGCMELSFLLIEKHRRMPGNVAVPAATNKKDQ